MPTPGDDPWLLSAGERHVLIGTSDGSLDLRRDDGIRVGKPAGQIRRRHYGCGAEDAPPN